ncbi:hypothetical protein QC763_0089190 [Podospora pseudopauciseta]|uniref:D-aminoacyl-tRNA deacylase n=1 Tax=Podospora pseudopauciseta TaxID=2093780 RepID=A0ABR0H3R3_9PEZI|nr:hypothetical protein QC763_0089190 [Podospora pseudopauciseta]
MSETTKLYLLVLHSNVDATEDTVNRGLASVFRAASVADHDLWKADLNYPQSNNSHCSIQIVLERKSPLGPDQSVEDDIQRLCNSLFSSGDALSLLRLREKHNVQFIPNLPPGKSIEGVEGNNFQIFLRQFLTHKAENSAKVLPTDLQCQNLQTENRDEWTYGL